MTSQHTSAGKGSKQSKKAAKDPNKPKRPPSAVFMSEFREQHKKEHPQNKLVAVVSKAGGSKCLECMMLSPKFEGKAPYAARAAKKKEEYTRLILAYNRKLEGKNPSEDESDKSRSEGHDDEEDEEEEDDE